MNTMKDRSKNSLIDQPAIPLFNYIIASRSPPSTIVRVTAVFRVTSVKTENCQKEEFQMLHAN